MGRKVSIEWIFSVLGIAFWLYSRDLEPKTLVCVFYSVFVGSSWSMIAKIADEKDWSWKHVLSPLFLLVIMMISGSLKSITSSEVVLITAMSLIHIRSAIFSFNRFSGTALLYPSLQVFSFIYLMVYLFQKSLLPFAIHSSIFWVSTLILGTASIMLLYVLNRKNHAEITSSHS